MKRVTARVVFDVDEGEGWFETLDSHDITTIEFEDGTEIGVGAPDVSAVLVESSVTVTDPPREWKFGAEVTPDNCPKGEFWVVVTPLDDTYAPWIFVVAEDFPWARILEDDMIDHSKPYRLVGARDEVVR